MISKAQVQALAAGDAWLEGANLLCFGPPRRREIPSRGGPRFGVDRKGLAFCSPGVQKLQIARRDLAPEAAIATSANGEKSSPIKP